MSGLLGRGQYKKAQSNLLRQQAGKRADMIAAEVARDEAMRNAAQKESAGTVIGAVSPFAYQYAKDNNIMGMGKGSKLLNPADYATMKSAVDAMPQNELGNQTRELFKSQYGEMNNADKFGQWVDKTLNDTTQTLTGTQNPAPVSPNSPLAADPLKTEGLLEAQTGPGAETTALAAPEPGLEGVMHQHQAGGEWAKGPMESGVVEQAPVDPATIVQPTTPEGVVGATQGPPDLTGVAPTDSLAPVTENLASGAIEEVGKEGLGAVGKSTVVEAGKNAVAAETGKAVAGETTKVISSNVATEATKAITGEATKNITTSAANNLAATAAANGVKSVATSTTASVASSAASMGAGIAGGLAGGAIGEAIGGQTGGKVGSALGSALAAGMMLGPWGAVAALAISGIMELF